MTDRERREAEEQLAALRADLRDALERADLAGARALLALLSDAEDELLRQLLDALAALRTT